MAKPPALKKEKVGKAFYWVAWIRGKKRSFGNASKVSFVDAHQAFSKALKTGPELVVVATKNKKFTVGEMVDDYLAWLVKEGMSQGHIDNNNSLFRQFLSYVLLRTGKTIAAMPAGEISAKDISAYLDYRKTIVEAGTIWHDYKVIAACWNWAAGRKGHPASHLLPTNRPFNELICPPKPKKELLADDLLTDEEYDLIMSRSAVYQADELFTIMYETGCRPGDLENCVVRDFDKSREQLVLYKHKNNKRQVSSKPRRVMLPDQSFAIVSRRAKEREAMPDAPLFVGPDLTGLVNQYRKPDLDDAMIARVKEELALNDSAKEVADFLGIKRQVVQRIKRGKPFPSELKKAEERKQKRGFVRNDIPWTTDRLNAVLRGVRGNEIRKHITAYCFRDLFISEMLAKGETIFEVAKMVGTSAKMIEEHYGHFYQDKMAAKGKELAASRAARKAVLIDTPAQPVRRRGKAAMLASESRTLAV
jgi:integrase